MPMRPKPPLWPSMAPHSTIARSRSTKPAHVSRVEMVGVGSIERQERACSTTLHGGIGAVYKYRVAPSLPVERHVHIWMQRTVGHREGCAGDQTCGDGHGWRVVSWGPTASWSD